MLANHKSYWKWYRIAYLLVMGGIAAFFGTRVFETIRYWDLLVTWGAIPGRWYMLISGSILCLIAAVNMVVFLFFHTRFTKWICIFNGIVLAWVWVEQLFLSQISDRFGKIPFLLVETLIFTGWTFFVFRQEFVHDQVC